MALARLAGLTSPLLRSRSLAGIDSRPVCAGGVDTVLRNPDGNGKNYRLHMFLADGPLLVLRAGLVQALIVGAGASSGHRSAGAAGSGDGGIVFAGFLFVSPGLLPVVVGPTTSAPGADTELGNNGLPSSFNGVVCRGGRAHGDPNTQTLAIGAAGTDYGQYAGVVSSITGTPIEYGKANYGSYINGVNAGDGGGADVSAGALRSSTGHAGLVAIRYEI